jgi:hypothetical protein
MLGLLLLGTVSAQAVCQRGDNTDCLFKPPQRDTTQTSPPSHVRDCEDWATAECLSDKK